MSDVRSRIFAMLSKWSSVMYRWRFRAFRMGTTSVITIAVPEKIAPATK
jgi:hypothetical protein